MAMNNVSGNDRREAPFDLLSSPQEPVRLLNEIANSKREHDGDECHQVGDHLDAGRHRPAPRFERRPCCSLLGRRRIDHVADLADLVRWEAAALSVLADDLFVGRTIDAVDLIVGDVAVHPLNFRPKIAKH
jgi:hypothetical protein